MKISCKTIQGEANRLIDRPNQDALSIQYSQGITGVCLCDGAGFSEYGGLAGKEISDLVCRYVIEHFYKWQAEKSRRELINEINGKLDQLAIKNNVSRKMLATTIMCVVLDEKNNMKIVHLGDGNILGQRKEDGSLRYLSSAQNGLLKNQTYLTGNEHLNSRLRVYSSRRVYLYKSIYLLSDGCDELYGDSYDKYNNSKIEVIDGRSAILRDDYSIIKLELS